MDPDPEPDPDPLVRGTDPGVRIRIRTKMSRIPNTATHIPFDEPISVRVELLSSVFYNIANKAKVGILTASSNGYFVIVKEAKIIVSVTLVPLQMR